MPTPAIPELKIATFNMHKGLSPLNRRHHLDAMSEGLRHLSVDLLFLQEVQGRHALHAGRFEDWPSEAQHRYLGRQLQKSAVYGLNATYEHGHHGNAILSRYPIRQWCNLDISVNRFEQRGVLHSEIHPPRWAHPVTALCVHLNLLARDRRKQFQALGDYIARAVPAQNHLILAGDFNDWRGEACSHLKEIGLDEVFTRVHGRTARSFPARLPLLTLDRIYTRGLVAESAEIHRGMPWPRLSDHLPLSASLRPLPTS